MLFPAHAPEHVGADAATMEPVTHDDPTPSPARPPRTPSKLTQREQFVVYFGFADEPGHTGARTDEQREIVRSRRIAGILVAGVVVGLLWAGLGIVVAAAVTVVGAIWFAWALRSHDRGKPQGSPDR